MTTPILPDPNTTANNIQPVIDAAINVIPANEVTKIGGFVKKYLKGEIVLVGSIATLVLQYVPMDSTIGHIASAVVAAVTIAGVVIAKNSVIVPVQRTGV